MNVPFRMCIVALGCVAMLASCGGGDDDEDLPHLSAATGASLASCTELTNRFSFANTQITSATSVAAGTLTVAGTPIGAHCLVQGTMDPRTGAIDGQSYAIGFEMRLPNAWNGRFFHQANGGIDGNVVPATGAVNGGSGLANALQMGFSVISSDAGHDASQNPAFGVDPQARLDYGYQAAMKLTPMAKGLIASAYGKGPDRSYFGGCSNGGRHTFVAMTRMPEQYDGYLAGAPGYRLPLAAIANIFGAQQYATVATDPADLGTGYTQAERATVSAAVLAKCDALDGAIDGLVQDTTACQQAFDLQSDVPTCSGARDGTCLSAAQKTAIAPIFSGAVDGSGNKFYASFPYDSGHAGGDVSFWEFFAPLVLDSGGVGLIWGVPPADPASFNGPAFSLGTSIDAMLASVAATNGTYTESALSFMLPAQPTQLQTLKNRGAKVMVYHGVSDSIFSVDDTTAWYEGLRANNSGDASNFARFFRVPGMNHCAGGPSTDQFDMLTALVDWVEKGQAPDSVIASARGPGNAAGANADVPAGWSASRSRPLCPYPKVARLKAGATDLESAASFECR
ncbi:tannase/feruloyl esterase family alpha/beta hydrolase [Piscinibacter sp.]|uniref:tannase/feruloyl esterase family alpha/beta hydrolase n=1 Tax=Piscinibacter sp. TaxID=1903157 RepID=UPI002B93FF49|nr:tannase/feruloyl esterase family alpha/beta hydrolase [Albitalea sp.]HUG24807.1 tannase/feruloyl esterase family alpha/beta hydrolase [Albitalea sp.]